MSKRNRDQVARLEELLIAWRELAALRERQAETLLEVVQQLARDVLSLADVSPTDPLMSAIVHGARARARKVLSHVGAGKDHAH